MTIGSNTLRDLVRRRQVECGTLSFLYGKVYEWQEHLIRECFYDCTEVVPLLSFEVYDQGWRGKYQTTGPLGFDNVITLNFNGKGMNAAEDLLRTLAHELGHWAAHSTSDRGHSDGWRELMAVRCGLVYAVTGHWIRDLGLWWELTADLDTDAVDDRLLRS